MNIPCATCARPSSCRQDRHCNNPQDEEALLHAVAAVEVLGRRIKERKA